MRTESSPFENFSLVMQTLAARGAAIRKNNAASKAFAGTPEAADEKQNPIKDVAISDSTPKSAVNHGKRKR